MQLAWELAEQFADSPPAKLQRGPLRGCVSQKCQKEKERDLVQAPVAGTGVDKKRSNTSWMQALERCCGDGLDACRHRKEPIRISTACSGTNCPVIGLEACFQ